MANADFSYTTYIKTTPEKIWNAITEPKLTTQYWGHKNVSDWKKGSAWQHVAEDGKSVKLVGEVLESVPSKRLVLSWADPADKTDNSRVTFGIEPVEDMVRLNVIHGNFKANSTMPERIAIGWPRVLSSMKSFLETGKPLKTWAGHESCGK